MDHNVQIGILYKYINIYLGDDVVSLENDIYAPQSGPSNDLTVYGTHIIFTSNRYFLIGRIPDNMPSSFSETFPNRHAYNGILQRGVVSWEDCINGCVDSCFAVDFDRSRDDTCWHHTETSSCQDLIYKRGCTHYRIRSCILSAGGPCMFCGWGLVCVNRRLDLSK